MDIIQSMVPIQTSYNGYNFRSRLEARWAVAFDAMGIEYEYEPEGFTLADGTSYLPDFKLLNVRHRGADEWGPLFVEVKGQMSPADLKKISLFEEPIIVIGAIPPIGNIYKTTIEHDYEWSFRFIDGDEYHGFFSKYEGEIWFAGWDHDEWDYGRLIKIGFNSARTARFEHGEKGCIDERSGDR